MVGKEVTTEEDELKRAKMRRDAQELVEDLEEFEDEHGDVLTTDEAMLWGGAVMDIRKFR